MSMIYSGQIRTMMPKLHSQNYEGMQLIRPLYLIREDEIKRSQKVADSVGIHLRVREMITD